MARTACQFFSNRIEPTYLSRRVQLGRVVPEHSVDDLDIRLAPRYEAFAAKPLHLSDVNSAPLQALSRLLRAAAHGGRDAVLREEVPDVLAGVSGCHCRCGRSAPRSCRMALIQSHAQRFDDDILRHVLAQRPRHRLAAAQVDHHGQEQPAFAGRDPSDVARPDLIGSATSNGRSGRLDAAGKSELAVCGDLEAALALGPDAVQLNKLAHALLAHAHASGQRCFPTSASSRGRRAFRRERPQCGPAAHRQRGARADDATEDSSGEGEEEEEGQRELKPQDQPGPSLAAARSGTNTSLIGVGMP